MTSPAAAHPAAPQGTVNCAYSATASFSPPLTPGEGTTGFPNETMTLTGQTLTACTGLTTPAGFLPTAGVGKDLKIKFPGGSQGREKVSDGCTATRDGSDPFLLKPKFSWANGIKMTKSTLDIPIGGRNVMTLPNVILEYSGTVAKGSFAGEPIQMNLVSSAAIVDCLAVNTGPESIASAMVIPSLSSVTIA
jgi:hypothetical protein